MRHFGKTCFCFAAALLLAAVLTVGALADITAVRSVGDGTVEIKWSDTQTAYLAFTPKLTDSFSSDLDDYGYIITRADSGKSFTMLYMAPDQSYWVVSLDDGLSIIDYYGWDAPARVNFSEFRQKPSMSNFTLKKKNAAGTTSSLSAFSKKELENSLESMSWGAGFQYNYPQLKNARHYLGQVILTSPDGVKYVDTAYDEELPAGHTYATVRFLPLNDYFSHLIKHRGGIQTGRYNLAICWDGQYVFSSDFTVK